MALVRTSRTAGRFPFQHSRWDATESAGRQPRHDSRPGAGGSRKGRGVAVHDDPWILDRYVESGSLVSRNSRGVYELPRRVRPLSPEFHLSWIDTAAGNRLVLNGRRPDHLQMPLRGLQCDL
jgi:hypothetical protein